MDNTLQITNGKITLNGAPVYCVKDFGLRTLDGYPCTAEVYLVLDVPFSKMKAVNAKIEQPEESHLNITIDGEKIGEIPISKPEPQKKSLYREFLGKELGLLEAAQEAAVAGEAFGEALSYGSNILELAKRIDELDSHEAVDESVDQSPVHQPEAPIQQLETPAERKKLLEFAVEGAKNKESKLITLLIQTKDKERVIDEMHDLIDYRKQLEQKLDKLNQNG